MKQYWDPLLSLSRAIVLASNGSTDHRDMAIEVLYHQIHRMDPDAREKAPEMIVKIIDGCRIDPSRPITMVAYVIRCLKWQAVKIRKRRAKDAGKLVRFVDGLEYPEHTCETEVEENLNDYEDPTVRELVRTVRETGEFKGAVKVTAERLNVTRQAIWKRLNKVRAGHTLKDFC